MFEIVYDKESNVVSFGLVDIQNIMCVANYFEIDILVRTAALKCATLIYGRDINDLDELRKEPFMQPVQ
jgi:hypothetical protein